MLPSHHRSRRATRQTLAQIRAAAAAEQRLREELGIDPIPPVTFLDSPSLDTGTEAPTSARWLSRDRQTRGHLISIAAVVGVVGVVAVGAAVCPPRERLEQLLRDR